MVENPWRPLAQRNPLPPRQYDENLLAHGIVRFSDARRLEPIGDPEWNDDEVTPMPTQLPDSILQSAIYGRLMAAALSAVSAGVLVLDQAQAALAAGLAIVGAALAVASKVREWLRARQ